MDEIPEKTTYILTFSFFDEDNLPVVPSSVKYRIDDVTSGTRIKATTSLAAPLATSMDVEVDAEDNYILADNHPYETRRVTVRFTYGSDKKGNDDYQYKIRNLPDITPSASASASASAS